MESFLNNMLYPALGTAVSILLCLVLNAALDWLKRWAATMKHGQAFGIVLDAAKASFNGKIKPSIQAKLADGKITDEEWSQLRAEVKAAARETAIDNIKHLRGFLPADLNKWVDTQLDVALGELFGPASSGEDEETDPTANTPASED